METLRMTSTRALWDPSYYPPGGGYEDATGAEVAPRMVPRMRQWVADNYPGTMTAITEYNWGAPDSITGAIAQADILGIFGREQLDYATVWTSLSPTTPAAFAFKIYLNYDGNGGQFGGTSVSATSGNPDQLSIFAALRYDSALTSVVLNKTSGADHRCHQPRELHARRRRAGLAVQQRQPRRHRAPARRQRGRQRPQRDIPGLVHHAPGDSAGAERHGRAAARRQRRHQRRVLRRQSRCPRRNRRHLGHRSRPRRRRQPHARLQRPGGNFARWHAGLHQWQSRAAHIRGRGPGQRRRAIRIGFIQHGERSRDLPGSASAPLQIPIAAARPGIFTPAEAARVKGPS